MSKSDNTDKGWLFNIQKFSLHDGPGIRDLIFLKGCPLRCQWCSNPESQRPNPEIACNADRCIGFESCGLCLDICPEKAISLGDSGQVRIDRSLCNDCGDCATVCPDRGLEVIGRKMSIQDILDTVASDDGFHYRSGGGVTVGGGDPIMQADFVSALLSACRDRGGDTAIETAGFGKWDQLEKICRYANLVFYDIKSMDAEKHKSLTGVSNKTILTNLTRLANRFAETPIVVRTPVIPGFNDTCDDILLIVKYLNTIKTLQNYQLLPYHRFGTPKYTQLGKTSLYADTLPPDDKCMQRLCDVVKRHLVLHPGGNQKMRHGKKSSC